MVLLEKNKPSEVMSKKRKGVAEGDGIP